MSRSGYNEDDCGSQEEQWMRIRWRGAVMSAIRGKRGQAFLRRALIALDAMNKKELAANTFEADGQYCLMGAVAKHEGVGLEDFQNYDEENDYGGKAAENLGCKLGIAPAMAREIVWENDEGGRTDRSRYVNMRRWLIANIKGDLL